MNQISCSARHQKQVHLNTLTADASGQAVEFVDLWPIACWDCGFECCRGHGCLCLVSVVCFQVEVSASGWSLIQRSPTDWCVSECDREASIWGRSCPLWTVASGEKNKTKCMEESPYCKTNRFTYRQEINGTQMFSTVFTWVSRPLVHILSQIIAIQFPYMRSWCVYGKPYFLDAFTMLRKEIISFVMSVCLSVSHWKDFHKTWYLRICRKSVVKIPVSS
jgi:hypothetical protein